MNRQSEAERLREHRLIFERALRDRVGMTEARARIARERWEAAAQRMAARTAQGQVGLCGTAAPAIAEDVTDGDSEGRELAWWQR